MKNTKKTPRQTLAHRVDILEKDMFFVKGALMSRLEEFLVGQRDMIDRMDSLRRILDRIEGRLYKVEEKTEELVVVKGSA